MGERAALTDGRRTASLQALTDCVVAVAAHDQIDQGKLAVLAEGHRREEQHVARRATAAAAVGSLTGRRRPLAAGAVRS